MSVRCSGHISALENHSKYPRHTKIAHDLMVYVNVLLCCFTIIKQYFLYFNQIMFPEFVVGVHVIVINTYSQLECTLSKSQKDVHNTRNNFLLFLSHFVKTTISLFFFLWKKYDNFIFHLDKKRNFYVCITRAQNSNKPPIIFKMPNYKKRENILICLRNLKL